MNRLLWVLQGLLSPLFLFAGGAKLAMPLDELGAQSGLPGPLLLIVAVAEVLGGFGLILPGLLRVKRGLTPLAAAGLTIIMVGATVLTTAGVGGGNAVLALMPLSVGLLTALVAYGRREAAPQRRAAREPALSAAA